MEGSLYMGATIRPTPPNPRRQRAVEGLRLLPRAHFYFGLCPFTRRRARSAARINRSLCLVARQGLRARKAPATHTYEAKRETRQSLNGRRRYPQMTIKQRGRGGRLERVWLVLSRGQGPQADNNDVVLLHSGVWWPMSLPSIRGPQMAPTPGSRDDVSCVWPPETPGFGALWPGRASSAESRPRG